MSNDPAAPPATNSPAAADSARRTTLVLAVAGFVLSFFALLSIAGLVLSILAFHRTRTTGGPRGLALAGIIIASITIAATIAGTIVLATSSATSSRPAPT